MAIECLLFKPYTSGSLQGFANFWIPKMGVEINGCSLHMKDGKRWVNLPQHKYTNESGETKYVHTVYFRDRKINDVFCEHAKKAIDDWCEAQASKLPEETPMPDPEESEEPF